MTTGRARSMLLNKALPCTVSETGGPAIWLLTSSNSAAFVDAIYNEDGSPDDEQNGDMPFKAFLDFFEFLPLDILDFLLFEDKNVATDDAAQVQVS